MQKEDETSDGNDVEQTTRPWKESMENWVYRRSRLHIGSPASRPASPDNGAGLPYLFCKERGSRCSGQTRSASPLGGRRQTKASPQPDASAILPLLIRTTRPRCYAQTRLFGVRSFFAKMEKRPSWYD